MMAVNAFVTKPELIFKQGANPLTLPPSSQKGTSRGKMPLLRCFMKIYFLIKSYGSKVETSYTLEGGAPSPSDPPNKMSKIPLWYHYYGAAENKHNLPFLSHKWGREGMEKILQWFLLTSC